MLTLHFHLHGIPFTIPLVLHRRILRHRHTFPFPLSTRPLLPLILHNFLTIIQRYKFKVAMRPLYRIHILWHDINHRCLCLRAFLLPQALPPRRIPPILRFCITPMSLDQTATLMRRHTRLLCSIPSILVNLRHPNSQGRFLPLPITSRPIVLRHSGAKSSHCVRRKLKKRKTWNSHVSWTWSSIFMLTLDFYMR